MSREPLTTTTMSSVSLVSTGGRMSARSPKISALISRLANSDVALFAEEPLTPIETKADVSETWLPTAAAAAACETACASFDAFRKKRSFRAPTFPISFKADYGVERANLIAQINDKNLGRKEGSDETTDESTIKSVVNVSPSYQAVRIKQTADKSTPRPPPIAPKPVTVCKRTNADDPTCSTCSRRNAVRSALTVDTAVQTSDSLLLTAASMVSSVGIWHPSATPTNSPQSPDAATIQQPSRQPRLCARIDGKHELMTISRGTEKNWPEYVKYLARQPQTFKRLSPTTRDEFASMLQKPSILSYAELEACKRTFGAWYSPALLKTYLSQVKNAGDARTKTLLTPRLKPQSVQFVRPPSTHQSLPGNKAKGAQRLQDAQPGHRQQQTDVSGDNQEHQLHRRQTPMVRMNKAATRRMEAIRSRLHGY